MWLRVRLSDNLKYPCRVQCSFCPATFVLFYSFLSSLAEAAAPPSPPRPRMLSISFAPLAYLFIYGDARLPGRVQIRWSLPPPADVWDRRLEKGLLTRFSSLSQSSWPFRTQNTNIRLLFSLQNKRPFKRHSRKRVKELWKVRQSRLHFRVLTLDCLPSACTGDCCEEAKHENRGRKQRNRRKKSKRWIRGSSRQNQHCLSQWYLLDNLFMLIL